MKQSVYLFIWPDDQSLEMEVVRNMTSRLRSKIILLTIICSSSHSELSTESTETLSDCSLSNLSRGYI